MDNNQGGTSLLARMSGTFSAAKEMYDEAILQELKSDEIGLAYQDIVDLHTNEIQYRIWSLKRRNQLISKMSHLPLLNDTIFQLDMACFELLLSRINSDKDPLKYQNSLQLRSSSLTHKDFNKRFNSIIKDNELHNLLIFLYFNERYDEYDEGFTINFDLLKKSSSKVILDSFGSGHGTVVLFDTLDFDGVKINSSVKMLYERQPSVNRGFLMRNVLCQIRERGNVVIAPLIFSNEIRRFYIDIGCNYGVET